jgi:integrase
MSKLTQMAVKNAKPRERAYKIADGAGMYLYVKPSGARYWRLDYRYRNKHKTLALGVYPEVTLAEARVKREHARRQIADGLDPSHARKIARLTGAKPGKTFRDVAEELIEKMASEERAKTTIDKTKWVFDFAYPFFGDRLVNEITAQEVLAALRTVEAKGHYETARRLRSKCGQVFRLAIATGRAERDPTQDLRGALTAPKTKHYATIVKPDEIGVLLRKTESYSGHPTTRLALQLIALTFVRPGELRHAEWSEFDFKENIWEIPAEKMKMRRIHRIPLSKQALTIIDTVRPISSKSPYLFPTVSRHHRPMSENTMTGALRRMGYAKGQMTAHGFRAMAATRLNEMGKWSVDAIERQLAHQETNPVRRAYTHAAEYWDERVRMMQVWADYLDGLQSTPLKTDRRVK